MGNISGISVTGYEKSWPVLSLSLFKNEPDKYKAMLGYVEIQEFNRGFKVKKVRKATKKGTSITFEAITTQEDHDKVYADITTRLGYMLKENQ